MGAASAVGQTTFTILKSLRSDAAVPFCHLIEGTDGAMYGTTVAGGISNSGAVFSEITTRGTLFKLDEDGNNYTVLHTFIGSPTDGQQIQSKLLQGTDGALYGTTSDGGSANYRGAIFKINKDGSGYSVLRSF